MTRGFQGSQFTQAGLGGDQPHICGSPGWLTQVELAGIDLFQRPRTSSKTGSEPGRILPMVMAEAPRLRGAHTPAEGLELEHLHFCLILLTGTNPWQDPTLQGRGVCSTYSGRAWQNRMAMGVETGRRAILAIYLYYYHCSSLGHSNRTPSVGWLKPHIFTSHSSGN